jgi:uncharacterized protein (DUF1330 family)
VRGAGLDDAALVAAVGLGLDHAGEAASSLTTSRPPVVSCTLAAVTSRTSSSPSVSVAICDGRGREAGRPPVTGARTGRILLLSCQGGIVSAYVIYQGEVFDPVRYDEYKVKAAASIAAAGGRYIVRAGEVEVLEGEPPVGRTVVLEFPTMDAALAWYRSEEYTQIRTIRDRAARARMYVVDGVE